jgi:hypothetical protein
LDLYLVVGERGVTGLPARIYHYDVAAQALSPLVRGDFHAPVAAKFNKPSLFLIIF